MREQPVPVPQPVELDLRPWQGAEPVELLGGVRFPPIGELPYLLTLAGHGFYWFRLPVAEPDERTVRQTAVSSRRPQLDRSSSRSAPSQRWFAGKGTDVRRRRDGTSVGCR